LANHRSIKWIEVLTAGRDCARIGSCSAASIQVMRVATIEQPHRLRLFVEHPDLHNELDHLIDGVYGGG
jgi:hypothetical protein